MNSETSCLTELNGFDRFFIFYSYSTPHPSSQGVSMWEIPVGVVWLRTKYSRGFAMFWLSRENLLTLITKIFNSGLDPDTPTNFQPISNLPFLSKMNNTKKTLLKITNDILLAANSPRFHQDNWYSFSLVHLLSLQQTTSLSIIASPSPSLSPQSYALDRSYTSMDFNSTAMLTIPNSIFPLRR